MKYLLSLQQKKTRHLEKKFLVEGVKMVEELIENHSELIEEVWATSSTQIQSDSIEINPISSKDLQRISAHKSPNGCFALVRFPEVLAKGQFTLVLDEIQDPGNMGTIIRLADWYGIDDIVCSNTTVDCFNPKVIQSCMGSLFRTAIRYTDLREYLAQDARPKYATLLNGQNLYQTELKPSAILVLGNEGNGVSAEVENLCEHAVNIPRIGKAESLNVSIAGAICLAAFFGK